jgi:hypothetical protein
MSRTIKDAAIKHYHYDSHTQLETHLELFLDAYNHARRLKTLRGLPFPLACGSAIHDGETEAGRDPSGRYVGSMGIAAGRPAPRPSLVGAS